MNETAIVELAREAMWVSIKVGGPVLTVGLVVGLIVSLVQALTQVQEMTLTFVPKVLAMAVALVVALPFMLATLTDFTEQLYGQIAGFG